MCDAITGKGLKCKRSGFCGQHWLLRNRAAVPKGEPREQRAWARRWESIVIGLVTSVIGSVIFVQLWRAPKSPSPQASNSSNETQVAAVVTSPQPSPLADRLARNKIATASASNASSTSAASLPEVAAKTVYACPTNPATNSVSGVASQLSSWIGTTATGYQALGINSPGSPTLMLVSGLPAWSVEGLRNPNFAASEKTESIESTMIATLTALQTGTSLTLNGAPTPTGARDTIGTFTGTPVSWRRASGINGATNLLTVPATLQGLQQQ